jgi:hypothetical protein
MKKYESIVILLGCCHAFLMLSNASAQTMEFDTGNLSKIEVYFIYGKINVVGTDDNKMFLEVTAHKEVPAGFNSLKFDLRESNSEMDLHIENNGTILTIYPSSIQAKLSNYLLKVPKSLMLKIDNNGGDLNRMWHPAYFKSVMTDTILIENMVNDIEIYASTWSTLRIIDISGPIVANSNTGDIYIKFSSLSQVKPSSIKSSTGRINLILPQTINCDIKESSFCGKFYSELALNNMEETFPDPEVRCKTTVADDEADTKISGHINNGGVTLHLRTLNSDINLRKY